MRNPLRNDLLYPLYLDDSRDLSDIHLVYSSTWRYLRAISRFRLVTCCPTSSVISVLLCADFEWPQLRAGACERACDKAHRLNVNRNGW
jgi:hypothetical protein